MCVKLSPPYSHKKHLKQKPKSMFDNSASSGAPSSSSDAFASLENGVTNKRKRRPAGTQGNINYKKKNNIYLSFSISVILCVLQLLLITNFGACMQIQMLRWCLSLPKPYWNQTGMCVRSVTKVSKETRIYRCIGEGTKCHGNCSRERHKRWRRECLCAQSLAACTMTPVMPLVILWE